MTKSHRAKLERIVKQLEGIVEELDKITEEQDESYWKMSERMQDSEKGVALYDCMLDLQSVRGFLESDISTIKYRLTD